MGLPLRTPTGILSRKAQCDGRYMTGNFDSTRDTVDPLDVVVANLPLLMLVGGLSAMLLAIAAVFGLLVLVSGALFSLPEYDFRGTTLEGGWMLLRFGPLLLLHGGLAAAVAYGTWMEKRWSRGLTLLFWASIIVSASVAAMLHPVGGRFWFTVALGSLPILLGSWLYFYYWGRVVSYYAGLRKDGGHDESG